MTTNDRSKAQTLNDAVNQKPIKHVGQKKINHLIRAGRLGYYLTIGSDHFQARTGDYTDGQYRYHLIENGKCSLSDCEI